jgi:hypothetical protein
MFISGVNDTGDEREKFTAINFFIFCELTYLSALYTCRLIFSLFFMYMSRQAGIVSTVLSAVLSLTPVNNFSALSLEGSSRDRLRSRLCIWRSVLMNHLRIFSYKKKLFLIHVYY